jgi:hypothetical protein
MREWLLVIAAVASAVAAALSLVAANRQESATYESQLYNKQVDTISAFVRSAEDNSAAIDEEYGRYLASRSATQDDPPFVPGTISRETTLANRFFIDYSATWLVVPDEVRDTLHDSYIAMGKITYQGH